MKAVTCILLNHSYYLKIWHDHEIWSCFGAWHRQPAKVVNIDLFCFDIKLNPRVQERHRGDPWLFHIFARTFLQMHFPYIVALGADS